MQTYTQGECSARVMVHFVAPSLYHMQVQSIILLAVLGEKLNICPPQPGLMDSFSLLSDAQLSLILLDNLQQMPQDESNTSGTLVLYKLR